MSSTARPPAAALEHRRRPADALALLDEPILPTGASDLAGWRTWFAHHPPGAQPLDLPPPPPPSRPLEDTPAIARLVARLRNNDIERSSASSAPKRSRTSAYAPYVQPRRSSLRRPGSSSSSTRRSLLRVTFADTSSAGPSASAGSVVLRPEPEPVVPQRVQEQPVAPAPAPAPKPPLVAGWADNAIFNAIIKSIQEHMQQHGGVAMGFGLLGQRLSDQNCKYRSYGYRTMKELVNTARRSLGLAWHNSTDANNSWIWLIDPERPLRNPGAQSDRDWNAFIEQHSNQSPPGLAEGKILIMRGGHGGRPGPLAH